ncbi:MAG: ATP-binding protein [Ignavibacteria bacterium]|jgi:signal transduction histidine kinase
MRYTITKKITVPFILIIILLVAVGTFSTIELNNSHQNIHELLEETKKGKALADLQLDIRSLLITAKNYIITEDQQYYDNYNNLGKKIIEKLNYLEGLLILPGEKQKSKDIKNNIDSIKAALPQLLSATKSNANDSVAKLIYKLNYTYDANIDKAAQEFIKSIQTKVDKTYDRIHNERKKSFIFFSLIFFIAVIISVAVVIYSIKYISKPILKLVNMAQRIAARDFNVELQVEAKDEIGMLIIAFNAMVDEISKRYEELENFSFIAAHDLKSPLTAIVGSAGILLEEYQDKINEEDSQLLQAIINSGEKMTALITDLLEFATAGKVEFSKEIVSMSSMLNEIREELDFTIKKQNVKLIIQENLPSFICDPVRFPQVWKNLISNSIKYNDKPEPIIEIGEAGNNNYPGLYCFFVKDNGIGIDKKDCDKIFNPFQRATSDKQFEGTGIGLAIVKRIIEFHNGKVWVESQKGKGTTFYFTIPKEFIVG